MAKLPDLPSWSEIRKSARVEAGLDLSGFKNNRIVSIGSRHWVGPLGRTYFIQSAPTRATWEWKNHESKQMLDVVADALAPHGYRVPRIVADFNAGSHHRKHRIIIREFMPGMSMQARLPFLTPQKRVHVYREMGKLLGLLHTEVPYEAAPNTHHGWNIPVTPASAYRHAGSAIRKLGWSKKQGLAYCAVLAQIGLDREDELAQNMDRKLFVHSDWAERNIITAPDGKISGAIDFELATRSNLFTELSQCMPNWPQEVPHLLKGYNDHTGLALQANSLFACNILRSARFMQSKNMDLAWLDNRLHDDITEWAISHPQLSPQMRKTIRAAFTPT